MNSLGWWIVFLIGVLYFFLPLVATFQFSLKARPAFAAYTNSFADPQFFASLFYSLVVGIVTIILSLALIVGPATAGLATTPARSSPRERRPRIQGDQAARR